MSKTPSPSVHLAIYDNAYKRFENSVVQSFQMENLPDVYLSHRKIAERLGADPVDCVRCILRVMSELIRTTNNDKSIITTSAEAHAFITRIRRVAMGWGIEDTFIDMAFCVNGLRLLETTIT